MKIAIIQNKVYPQFEKTLDHVKTLVNECKEADLLLFPELWNAPYENKAILDSEQYFEASVQFLSELSKEYHCIVVAGSMAERQGKALYNTCFIFENGKQVGAYRKMHLMEFHGRNTYTEKEIFTPGNQLFMLPTALGTLGVVICYDLRFPELPRLLAQSGIDILLVPAAFNQQVGKEHWQALVKTRAMENQIFVAAANPAQYTYQTYTAYGHSMIVDPFGHIIEKAGNRPAVIQAEIDLSQIKKIRHRMPFWDIRRTDVYSLQKQDKEDK